MRNLESVTTPKNAGFLPFFGVSDDETRPKNSAKMVPGDGIEPPTP